MKKSQAFTLIEILISVSIFSIIMIVLYSSFSSGMFGYRRTEEDIKAYQSARLALESLNADLRNAFAYSTKDAKFSGKINEVVFLTLVNDYQEEGIVRNIAFVSYYQDSDKLMRLCRRNQECLKSDSKVKAQEVISGLSEITFTYIYRDKDVIKELDSWDNLKNIPQAVKVKLVLKNSRNYVFVRTIYLFVKTDEPS